MNNTQNKPLATLSTNTSGQSEILSKPELDLIMTGQSWRKPFTTKEALEAWCADNQPYIKSGVPEVVAYFTVMYGIR